MNQSESLKIAQVCEVLGDILKQISELSAGTNVNVLLKDSCVEKVTGHVAELDKKLNEILIAVSIIKKGMNGEASVTSTNTWALLNLLTEKLSSIDMLCHKIDNYSGTTFTHLTTILREISDFRDAVVRAHTTQVVSLERTTRALDVLTTQMTLTTERLQALSSFSKVAENAVNAKSKFWRILTNWLIRYGSVISALMAAIAAAIMALSK